MRAPDKDRYLRAVRHIESPEIPFQEDDPDMALVNQILGKNFPLGLHAYELPVEDYVELNRRMGNDLIYFADIWRLGRKERTDPDGRIHYVDGVMKTPACLKDIRFPDLDETKRRIERTLRAIDGTGLGLMGVNKHAPALVATAVGLEDYWTGTLESPGFIREFQTILHEFCLRELELYAGYPMTGISLASFMGMRSGPVCSRAVRRDFHYPFLREQIELAHRHGLVVRLHVDGNVETLIEEFIDLGVDVLHPIEPCDGQQDIFTLKQKYGRRIALHGNIDVNGVLRTGMAEEVRRDIIAHMERLADGGGYIVGSSHDLNPLIPLENFYAMRDAVHDYRFERRRMTAGNGSLT